MFHGRICAKDKAALTDQEQHTSAAWTFSVPAVAPSALPHSNTHLKKNVNLLVTYEMVTLQSYHLLNSHQNVINISRKHHFAQHLVIVYDMASM